jgi:hypothetical protein
VSKAKLASVFLPPLVYRCEQRGSRVFFTTRQIESSEACPAGWFATEQDARDDMSKRLTTAANELLRQAYELRNDKHRSR